MTEQQTTRAERVATLQAAGVIAVLRAPSAEHAVTATAALVAGGVRGIEITYSTPGAPEAIREIADTWGATVLVGAGTVLTEPQAHAAAAAGARFLVSPGNDPGLAPVLRRTGLTVCLGALTPSEVMAADRAGADVVKVFPSSLGGPRYLKALRDPFPSVPLMPTGGVTPANLGEWLAAGAVAVGAGGDLCPPAALAAGDWHEVEARARAFSDALSAAREAAA